jgi:hypothetical protein
MAKDKQNHNINEDEINTVFDSEFASEFDFNPDIPKKAKRRPNPGTPRRRQGGGTK